jgi:hypothetical protein
VCFGLKLFQLITAIWDIWLLMTSYCQMLWIGFDSGGVIYLDPVDEFGS